MKMPSLFGQPLYVYVAVVVVIWFFAKSGSTVVDAAITQKKETTKKTPINSNDGNVARSRLNNMSEAKPSTSRSNWVEEYPGGFSVMR